MLEKSRKTPSITQVLLKAFVEPFQNVFFVLLLLFYKKNWGPYDFFSFIQQRCIKFSAFKLLIAINQIQNSFFFTYYMCLFCLYLLWIYIYTKMHVLYLRKKLRLYIKYIYIWYNYRNINVNTFKIYDVCMYIIYIYYANKLLFWMQLIVINRLTALIKSIKIDSKVSADSLVGCASTYSAVALQGSRVRILTFPNPTPISLPVCFPSVLICPRGGQYSKNIIMFLFFYITISRFFVMLVLLFCLSSAAKIISLL